MIQNMNSGYNFSEIAQVTPAKKLFLEVKHLENDEKM